ANDSETLEQDARPPHPAFGRPLPASRGEGHSTLPPRVSFSPQAGGRCREAADEGLALREFGQHYVLPTAQPPTGNYNPRCMNLDEQLDFLAKGTVDLIERNDLKSKIARGKPVTIKVGFDP